MLCNWLFYLYLGNNGQNVLSPNATVLKDLLLFMYVSAKCAQAPSEARGGRRVPPELMLQVAVSRQIRRWQWKSGSLNQVLPC